MSRLCMFEQNLVFTHKGWYAIKYNQTKPNQTNITYFRPSHSKYDEACNQKNS